MPKYHTKQREVLINFLEENLDTPLSAKQIGVGLEKHNVSISAVYRNIAALEKEGLLLRHSKGGSREVYYQYTGAKGCKQKLHLSCTKCGKISHMENEGAKRLIEDIADLEDFAIDKGETVLYGLCSKCRK